MWMSLNTDRALKRKEHILTAFTLIERSVFQVKKNLFLNFFTLFFLLIIEYLIIEGLEILCTLQFEQITYVNMLTGI